MGFLNKIFKKDLNDDEYNSNNNNFKYLEKLTKSNSNEIHLEFDFSIDDAESSKYAQGIKIKRNNLIIDGKGFSIDAKGLARFFQINAKNILFKNMIFLNGCSEHLGGAFFINKRSVVKFENCKFNDNSSKSFGGAIFCNNNCEIIFENCEFNNNNSFKSNSGAIYIDKSSVVKFENCKFNNNSAKLLGGAIFTFIDSSVTLNNCLFNSNNAESEGGAIFNGGSNLKLNNCIFKSNSSKKNGGAINNYQKGIMSLVSCEFEKNQAFNLGGAIFNHEQSTIIMNKNILNSNSGEGGAIFNAKGDLKINECIFESNSSKENGGAINNFEGTINLDSCDFEDNTAKIDGAGIFNLGISSKSYVTLNNCTFEKGIAKNGPAIANYNGSINITDSSFEKNEGERGGALFNDKSSEMNIVSSNFQDNTSGLAGAIDNWNNLNISNCSFEGNKTSFHNAGVLCHMAGDLKIEKCQFENNSSSRDGAVFSIENGLVHINSSRIIENKSKYSVIINLSANLKISDCIFENNNCEDICILNCANLELNSVEFIEDNNIILANTGEANINDCSFDKQYKICNAGKIYVSCDKNEFNKNMIEKWDISQFEKFLN